MPNPNSACSPGYYSAAPSTPALLLLPPCGQSDRLLGDSAIRSCSDIFPDLCMLPATRHSAKTADDLQRLLNDIRSQVPLISRVVFLIDDAKFVLKWSSAFHGNLNHWIYGRQGIDERCVYASLTKMDVAIVFAGATELQSLLIDVTSPIGIRATHRYIVNLQRRHISDMLRRAGLSKNVSEVAEAIYQYTGGHAGLSCRIVRALLDGAHVDLIVKEVESQLNELFLRWNSSFTGITGGFLKVVAVNDRLARDLVRQNVNSRHVDRVWWELQYMGVAIRNDDDSLLRVNRFFWRQWRDVASVSPRAGSAGDVGGVVDMIKGGESETVEFKSTLRTPVGAVPEGRPRDIARVLEHEALKSVAGFLNTDGGVLFVGIDDGGNSVDLSVDFRGMDDRFDGDKMMRHLANLFRSRMTPFEVVSEYSNMQFVEHQRRLILMVKCRPANLPVFVERRLFRRLGTTTQELTWADEVWNHLIARYPQYTGAPRASDPM